VQTASCSTTPGIPAPEARNSCSITAGTIASFAPEPVLHYLRRAHQPTATLSLTPVTLVAEERTLKGSYIGTAVPSRDIPRYIELYQRGRLPVDRLMTGTLSLDEVNEGFDRLHDGVAIRQVIVLSGTCKWANNLGFS
jgi:threonine dehydrogenase-like Zn-dependent dehydrogenase